MGGLAVLGQQADPAAKAVPAADAPNGALTIGGVIALTGNANLYGQDQRLGISLARDWAESRRRQPGEAPLRPLHFQLQDGGSIGLEGSADSLLADEGLRASYLGEG